MANYITKAKAGLVEVLRHLGGMSDWIMYQSPRRGGEEGWDLMLAEILCKNNESESVPSRNRVLRPILRVRKKKSVNYLIGIYTQ